MERQRSRPHREVAGAQRLVTDWLARIGSIGGGQRTPSHKAGTHEGEAEARLNAGHGGELHSSQRGRNQRPCDESGADSHEDRKRGGDRRRLAMRERRESDAPEHHPRQVRDNADGRGQETWRIRYAKTLHHLRTQ